jgi:hypothetical protein
MSETTSKLRRLWKSFECNEASMVLVPFGPDRIRVAPPTGPAWDALAAVFSCHQYEIRTLDTDSYNCRSIKGTNQRSLHSYGIALDVNWTTNPFITTPDKRKVRFSTKATQAERAEDVRLGQADCDMTLDLIRDALAIRTRAGKPVFEWGGNWLSVKDPMHFELDVGPDDLIVGIDPGTVAGWEEHLGVPGEPAPSPGDTLVSGVPAQPVSALVAPAERYVVIARDGLRLRSGPSTDFAVIRTLPAGTVVFVLSREGSWGLVDLQGDGLADGFMHLSFLRPAEVSPGAPAEAVVAAPAIRDILDLVTPELAAKMFPVTRKASIAANLPFVLSGLRARSLTDRPMVLMALATIRAETEGFVPISEGVSRFNTRTTPFDLYDAGTEIGRRLGNSEPGDGPRFKGRGFVQLTGRNNYSTVGEQIGTRLVDEPERANEPERAGLILAQFLKNKESRIRAALAGGALKTARRLVNGGSHGFERFEDAYARGLRALPA